MVEFLNPYLLLHGSDICALPAHSLSLSFLPPSTLFPQQGKGARGVKEHCGEIRSYISHNTKFLTWITALLSNPVSPNLVCCHFGISLSKLLSTLEFRSYSIMYISCVTVNCSITPHEDTWGRGWGEDILTRSHFQKDNQLDLCSSGA